MGYTGPPPQQGAQSIARIANSSYIVVPGPVAPVHATAMGLLPQGLTALPQGPPQGRLARRGASLTLEPGWDAAHHRHGLFQAGLLPHLNETPRNRQPSKRPRQRCCNAVPQARRMRVERTLAWEDQFKRLLIRCECSSSGIRGCS